MLYLRWGKLVVIKKQDVKQYNAAKFFFTTYTLYSTYGFVTEKSPMLRKTTCHVI